jgi:hypothetical protein
MVDITKIPALDWQTPIVDPLTGNPSAQFRLLWQQLFQNSETNNQEIAIKITGPSSSSDNAVVRWDGVSGKLAQNSGVFIDDANNLFGISNFSAVGGGFLAANISGYTGLWLGADAFAPDLTNYSLLKESFGPLYNAPVGGLQAFRIGNENRINVSPNGAVVNQASNIGPPTGVAFQVYSPDYSTEWMAVTSTGVRVVDQAYSAAWDGDFTVPTKNAVYDKIETLTPGGSGTNPPQLVTFSTSIGSAKTTSDTTNGGIMIEATTDNSGLQAQLMAATAPFTFVAGLYGNTQANFNGLGLVVRDTAGKYVFAADLAEGTLELSQWSNAATFSSAVFSAAWASTPLYFRVVVDASNDVQWSISQTRNGPWHNLSTPSTYLGTVDAVGFAVNRNNASSAPVAWFFDYEKS